MQYRIFIGSSKESLDIAHAIEETLSEKHEPTVWDEGIFGLTESTLTGLISHLDKSDAAVFVLSPDDMTRLRGNEFATVRDNVIFELGLFIGRLGPKRTFFVIPNGQKDMHLPSDLLGITPATYNPNRTDKNWVAALRPACNRIERELVEVAQKELPSTVESDPQLNEGMAWMHDHVNRALRVFLSQDALSSPEASEIELVSDGFRIKLRNTTLSIRFGRIEECETREPGDAVALPATEFFDDDCAGDQRSALGAYLNKAFPGRLREVQGVISDHLKDEKTELVERETGKRHGSYGVGKCIYLDKILESDRKIILVSITTKRAGAGIRCEPHFFFAAMNSICQIMNDQKLTHLELPVMGSGHGGLEPELALLYLILAIRAVVEAPAGTHLRSVSIVVFQRDPTAIASIKKDVVKRILSVTKANT